MTHYTELAAPLIGCLYCHTEGTITERLPYFWNRSRFPRLVCSFCGSVAEFDLDKSAGTWRIYYHHCNSGSVYYYAYLVFQNAGWLDEDKAIDYSTNAYIQRRRNEQVRAGQLSWLQPNLPDTRPASLMPDEHTLAVIENVTLRRTVKAEDGTTIHDVDTGNVFLTDRRLHVHGAQRDWSYEYGAVIKASYDAITWYIAFSDNHFIEHTANKNELNAQIVVSLIETLRGGDGQLVGNR